MLSPTERHAIVAECQAIVTAFSVHADLGELEQCAALFTEDGQFERRGEMLTGRPAILAALRARPPLLHARHHCLPPHVTIRDADSADGITYFTIYRHEGALDIGVFAHLDIDDAAPLHAGRSGIGVAAGGGAGLATDTAPKVGDHYITRHAASPMRRT